MTTPHQDDPAGAPLSLSQLLALARAHSIDEQHAALERVNSGSARDATPDGDPYLLFTCASVACASPLTHFQEVLPALPVTVALPFSPPWMLGFFALHTELIGLVDPAPFLFDAPDMTSISRSRTHNGRVIRPGGATAGETWRHTVPESGPTALVVGTGEHILAFAVSSVGDMAYVRTEEIVGEQGSATSQRPLASRFLRGTYSSPDGVGTYQVVAMDDLLDVVMDALLHVEARSHE